MELQSKRQVKSGLYDFLADPSAGAIGTINLGLHIPQHALMTGFWVNTLAGGNPNSLGAATISFGLISTDSAPVQNLPVIFMPATAFGAFVFAFPNSLPLMGNDLNAAPAKVNFSFDVTMSIAVAALTAGKLQVWLEYTENLI